MADDDARREYKRQWRIANAERLREYGRAWREANQERLRQQKAEWHAANRQRNNERSRRYYAENRDQQLASMREYRERHQEELRVKDRQRYQVNGDADRRRVFMRTHGVDETGWAAKWQAQDGRCYLCERPLDPAKTHLDHWHGCQAHGPKFSCAHCQRGLACANCNYLIGLAGDDPGVLHLIARNLEIANLSISIRQESAPEQLQLGEA